MIVVYHENRKVIQLFWDDLSSSAKERLLELFGDNGNYDVFPLAELVIENETDENRKENEKWEKRKLHLESHPLRCIF